MSQSHLVVSGDRRLASEERTRSEDGTPYVEHYQHVVPTAIGAVPTLLSKYLATAGGVVDMAVDGSSVNVTHDLAPSGSEVYRVDRLVVVLATSSAPTWTAFGTIAALANGILLSWIDSDAQTIVDLLGGQPWKTLNDVAALASRIELSTLGSTHTARAVIDLPVPARLDGGETEKLRLTVRDNLSTLARLRVHALGAVEALT